jgi:hypothetical protein
MALATLDVSNNEIRAEGARKLAVVLQEKSSVTDLNMASNFIGHSATRTVDLTGVIALGESFKRNRSLSVLNLSDNHLCAEGGRVVARALGDGNSQIESVDVARNYLGVNTSGEPDYSGVAALADAVINSRMLSTLDTSNNQLGSEGVQFVAEALTNNVCYSSNPHQQCMLLLESSPTMYATPRLLTNNVCYSSTPHQQCMLLLDTSPTMYATPRHLGSICLSPDFPLSPSANLRSPSASLFSLGHSDGALHPRESHPLERGRQGACVRVGAQLDSHQARRLEQSRC